MVKKYSLKPFEYWHMSALEHTDAVDGFNAKCLDIQSSKALELLDSWSLIDEAGDIIGCAGTIPQWEGRCIAWVYLTQRSGKCMLRITRLVKKYLESVIGRIEMTVRADFKPGHKWARLLGFYIENPPGLLKGYGPQGEDHIAYVRIQ